MKMNLLLVDDEPDAIELFRQKFRKELRQGNYDIRFANSGADALQVLDENGALHPLVLLSDINMPGMTGLELLAEVKRRWPELEVIMVTAYGDEDNRRRAREAGASDFVTKPVDFRGAQAEARLVCGGGRHLMAAKILVVDDEPDLEMLVTQKFRRRIRAGELSFVFAHDGQEALDVLRAEPDIDMVLSDINMPRMDGLTLLNQLQSLSHLLRAVIVSAYGDMRNIRTAMNRGAFDFVTKPIDFDDLEATINRTLADLTAFREVYLARATAERAQANLARYFSPNLVNHLSDNGGSIVLGGERRELTFLATDLADFTSLVENLDPAAVVAVMNEYLGEVTRIVFEHGGTIDTVVGRCRPCHVRRAAGAAGPRQPGGGVRVRHRRLFPGILGPKGVGRRAHRPHPHRRAYRFGHRR